MSEIREREKKERKIGEAAGVAGEKKKERKKETVFFSETLPGSKIGLGCFLT